MRQGNVRGRGENGAHGRKGVKIGEEESWLDALPPCVHALLPSTSIGIAPAFFEEGETADDRPVERVESNCVYRDVHNDCNEKLQRRFYSDCCSVEKNLLRDLQFADEEHSIVFD